MNIASSSTAVFARACYLELQKQSRLRRSPALSLVLIFGLSLASVNANAWVIYNNSAYTMRAQVTQGDFDVTIAPGATAACNFGDTSCNPSGSQSAIVTVVIDSQVAAIPFAASMDMQAGGWTVIDDDWSSVYAVTVDVGGVQRDSSANGIKSATRSIRFMAGADGQYTNHNYNPGDPNNAAGIIKANADLVHGLMASAILSRSVNGAVYAGDLTANARQQEYFWYLDSWSGWNGAQLNLYDGLGNHDTEAGQGGACIPPFTVNNCEVVHLLANIVSRRRSATTALPSPASVGNPNYAWNWHDIYFAQLNNYPGVGTDPGSGTNAHDAFNFLVNDLQTQVGDSGRPVILVHHFDFDFVMNGDGYWWTDAERLAYWNAISGYNVIGIFVGHTHLSAGSSSWVQTWNRPPGTTLGPNSIPAYVSGYSGGGVYLDVRINSANQMKVERKDALNGSSVVDEHYTGFDRPIYLDGAATPSGYGWIDQPYSSFAQAVSAASDRFPGGGLTNTVEIQMKSGSYPGAITLNAPIVLNATGGDVTIGQ